MSSTSGFDDVRSRLATADRSLWLGRLTWYSVTDVKILHTALVQALVDVDLHGYIPRLPSDSDVFRRVCTTSQRRRVPLDDDTYENYLLRDLPTDATYVYKVLVRETVQAGQLSYEAQLAHITLTKATGEVEVKCAHDELAQAIVDDLQVSYNDERGKLDSHGLRELIRRILVGVNAINVRGSGGGVYFVAERHGDVLDHLEEFAQNLPGTVLFHTIPLLDDAKQREMLRRAFESETADEIGSLVVDIRKLDNSGRRISRERVATYMERLMVLRQRTKEYTALLQTSLDTAASGLSIFESQVLRLMTMMED